jgi:hypothetical protein
VSLLVAILGPACGSSGSGAAEDGRAAAAAFLDDLRAGRIEPAWQGTSVEFKSLMGLDSLRDYVRQHPALTAPAEFVAIASVESRHLTLAECTFRATPPAPAKGSRSRARARTPAGPATITVLISEDRDGWKVERLAVE